MTIGSSDPEPADPEPAEPGRRVLQRVTGVSGLAGSILVLGPIIASSAQEPGFDGDPAAVLTYFRSIAGPGFAVGRGLVAVGLIALLWYGVGLALIMARHEGPPPWRSAVAAASALPLTLLNLNGAWQAAAHRADVLTPDAAQLAFDIGNVAFANGWVAMASFAVCVGLVMLTGRFLRRWLGWVGIAAGVGLVLARFWWTNPVWFAPYALFWIWTVIIAVRLLRRS